jgi:LacI family transcriptional regulator
MGYHLIIGSTDEKKEKEELLLDMFVNRQVDGLIIASCFINSDALKSLSKQNFPIVFFDREDPSFLANYILVENKTSMIEAIQKTIDKGAKKIGLLSITPDVYSLKLRIDGYKQALADNGLEQDQNLLRIVDNNQIKESAKKELKYLIEAGVDVIVFTNNQITATAIWLMNMLYPEKVKEITFVSFDNLDIFDYSMPKVISIAQPIDSIAKHSVDILEDVIRTKESKNTRIELKPKLIER